MGLKHVGVKPKCGIWSADPTCLEEIANLKMRIWVDSGSSEVEERWSFSTLKGGHRKSTVIRKEEFVSRNCHRWKIALTYPTRKINQYSQFTNLKKKSDTNWKSWTLQNSGLKFNCFKCIVYICVKCVGDYESGISHKKWQK